MFPNLIRRIEAGQVKPLLAQIFGLCQFGDAQQHFKAKIPVGKLVIDVAGQA